MGLLKTVLRLNGKKVKSKPLKPQASEAGRRRVQAGKQNTHPRPQGGFSVVVCLLCHPRSVSQGSNGTPSTRLRWMVLARPWQNRPLQRAKSHTAHCPANITRGICNNND